MKTLRNLGMTIFFLFFSMIGKSQIPSLKSNTTPSEKDSSQIYNAFKGKYDFVISCREESYWWSDTKFYKIIAYRNGHWEKVKLTQKRNSHDIWSKPIITVANFDKTKADSIISFFNGWHFWKLNRDSLNISKKQNKDSRFTEYSISDAVNYKFEIITTNQFLIIEAYAPEYFFEKLPEIKEREAFIKCKNMFLSIYNPPIAKH